jgi:TolB-like protein
MFVIVSYTIELQAYKINMMYRFLILLSFYSNILQAQNNRGVIIVQESQHNVSGKFHAIIISENQYQDDKINDLNEPKNDADKLTSILVSKYFFKQEDIIRLVDPTRANILDAIEQKRKSLSVDDNLIIFYAGHGYWDEGLKMGYWLPSDAKKDSKSNWVSNTDLTLYLSAFGSNHVLLVSDACFSGGIFKTRSIGDMDQGTKRLYELKSRKAITSGNLKEVPDNSIFMKFFIKELEMNQNTFLTSDQLFAKIRPTILSNSSTEPLYGVIHNTGDEGGEFVFYNSGSSTVNSDDAIDLAANLTAETKRSMNEVILVENKLLDKLKKVAIISFDNSSGKESEYGDLGGPLRDMLTSDLKDVKNLTMVDRQALEKLLTEQNLNNSKSFDQATATKLGKLLGAEIIITGTYFEFLGSLRVDAKCINVETGEIAFSVGVDGAREKFFDLKKTLANMIIEKLK